MINNRQQLTCSTKETTNEESKTTFGVMGYNGRE